MSETALEVFISFTPVNPLNARPGHWSQTASRVRRERDMVDTLCHAARDAARRGAGA